MCPTRHTQCPRLKVTRDLQLIVFQGFLILLFTFARWTEAFVGIVVTLPELHDDRIAAIRTFHVIKLLTLIANTTDILHRNIIHAFFFEFKYRDKTFLKNEKNEIDLFTVEDFKTIFDCCETKKRKEDFS